MEETGSLEKGQHASYFLVSLLMHGGSVANVFVMTLSDQPSALAVQ